MKKHKERVMKSKKQNHDQFQMVMNLSRKEIKSDQSIRGTRNKKSPENFSENLDEIDKINRNKSNADQTSY